MTVVLITSVSRYIGDTADTKPTSCPTGSTFFDRQTGILYITYNGGANWVEKPSDDTVAGLLGGGLPAALGASGGLKVEGVAGGVAQPVSAASGAFASGAIANGADVAQGSTTDTPAIATEDNTARTVVSLLKGVKNTLYVNLLGALGATNGAAVVTDADGTIQQYLRGLVKLLVAKITVGLDSGTNVIGKARLVTATGDEVTEDTGNTVVVSGIVTATANQGAAGTANWLVTATQGAAGTAAWPVDGPLADDAAFTPGTSKVFPIGALADETSPDSVDEGDLGALRMTLSRILWVALRGKASASADTEIGASADYGIYSCGVAAGGAHSSDGAGTVQVRALHNSNPETQSAMNMVYNGSTWDRARNNISSTLLASAARTAETNSPDQTNFSHRFLAIIVNVSAIVDTPVLTPKLSIKDSISGNYKVIWTAAANITAAGTYAYAFDVSGLGPAGSFNEVAGIRVTRTWRLTMAVADADSATYSVSAELGV